MWSDLAVRVIAAMGAVIRDRADDLTALDQAIGDGDHGINMKRGFAAMEEAAEALSALPFPDALQKAGMTLVMTVGGASGPLFGSFLMAMGKAGDGEPRSLADLADRFAAGVEAVKRRGKSDVGEKTMLDVLVPVELALRAAASNAAGDVIDQVRSAAAMGLESTRSMRATKGRASFLGERSVGHLDPGAQSGLLLIGAVCDTLERRATGDAG